VSGLRSIASVEGFTIQASNLGKLKTIVQIVAVVATILAHRWFEWQWGWYVLPVRWTAYAAIYFMVLVSIVSAVDYFQAFWKQIDHSSSDRRKASVVLRRDKKNAAPVN
jgi:CDP-diacylglycerol--glycerol-3-phosphate 3-phosphatidyltransferase